MRRYLCLFLLAGLCAVTAFGQKPDFSGTWKQLDLSERSMIYKIDHREPNLSVRYEGRDEPSHTSTMVGGLSVWMSGSWDCRLDGVERMTTTDKGRQLWKSAGWEGDQLFFLTIEKDGYHVTVRRETWKISDSRERLAKTTRVIDMDGVRETTVQFQRQ